MNFAFLMDPLHTVIMEKDTSFLLMLGGHRRGHKVYFLPDGGITRLNGRLHFHVTEVTPQRVAEKPFIEHKSVVLKETDIHAVFVRSDPPFDEQYLLNTWLLDFLPKHIPVINRPSGIRTVNEKIWATQFTSLVPPTLVGRNRKDLLDFLSKEKNIVAKPTGGHGGASVFHVQSGGTNANVILETLTRNWQKEIILQKFIPESKDGDKRILLLNGDPLGAILRMHAEDDHRNNFFAGGKPLRAEINTRDREIIAILKPRLQALGLYLVGIDVIGEYLIEVNVTSPTCLQEMNALYKTSGEDKIIDFVENLIAGRETNPWKDSIAMAHLTLYYKPTCPYSQKVIGFLDQNGISVPLKNRDESRAIREELVKIGGKPQVPCLIIDGKAMYESDDIIQWFKTNWKKS